MNNLIRLCSPAFFLLGTLFVFINIVFRMA